MSLERQFRFRSKTDRGDEALAPFLNEGESLICNYDINPREGVPSKEKFIESLKKDYDDIRIIENAAFHSDGHLMDDCVAIVGKFKESSE